MAHFSRIEKKEEETKSVSESDSYGFEFASYKTATFIMPGFYMSCLALLLPRPDWNGGTGLLLLVVRLRM